MAVQRRARQLTGEDEMDEVGYRVMTAVSFCSPDLVWREMNHCVASVGGLWREKRRSGFGGRIFSVEQMRKGWQYKSSREASLCVPVPCPAGISFMALQRIHTELHLIRTVRLVKE